jgi:hypothetical protein
VQNYSIDLLVIGSHGRKGLAKLALGSVAEWAIRHLSCPVLVVGPKCNKVFGPVKSILFATDLVPDNLRSAQYANSIAQEYNATLRLMHVIPEGDTTELDSQAKRSEPQLQDCTNCSQAMLENGALRNLRSKPATSPWQSLIRRKQRRPL